MKISRLIPAIFTLLSMSQAFGAEYKYRIHGVRAVTPNVDRYLDKNGNAFASIFCRTDAASIMIVDNGPLDGVNFFFESPEVCNDVRSEILSLHKKCALLLVVDSQTKSASLDSSACQK